MQFECQAGKKSADSREMLIQQGFFLKNTSGAFREAARRRSIRSAEFADRAAILAGSEFNRSFARNAFFAYNPDLFC
jgi:hypothetical protein